MEMKLYRCVSRQEFEETTKALDILKIDYKVEKKNNKTDDSYEWEVIMIM